MKLHLGCGKRDFGPDWVHIDGATYPHIKYHDIKELPFDNNTVDVIYASHVFEYFDRMDGFNVLMEWYRVLKVGGKIRLAVPDFEVMCKLYTNKEYPLDNFIGPLYGKMMMDDTIIYHKTAYDFSSLSTMLQKAGFVDCKRYDWRSTEHADVDDQSQAYLPHMDKENGTLISLNIEATK